MKIPVTIQNAAACTRTSLQGAKNWAHQKIASMSARDYAKYTAITISSAAAAYLLYTQASPIVSDIRSQQELFSTNTCSLSEKVSVLNNASLPVCQFLNAASPSIITGPFQQNQTFLHSEAIAQEALDLDAGIDYGSAVEQIVTRVKTSATSVFGTLAALWGAYVTHSLRALDARILDLEFLGEQDAVVSKRLIAP